ncbi:MAG: elongation factor 1-beta [Thermoprotei archaeon]|nr:MAG: elongation factor 1-beta [Thermoprotei archaeon]RLF03203.1 MAG: elongation factor 1-beta [Thermoprotei archaeon]
MAKVMVLARIFPSEIGVDLNKVLESIKEKLPIEIKINDYKEEPIAFGLKALKVQFLMPEDFEGGTTVIENLASEINEVSQVEILMVSRI